MKIVDISIRHWHLMSLIFAMFSALGIQSFLAIPRSADPHFSPPIVVLTIVMPGTNAAEIEEMVTKPIEDSIQSIDKIRFIESKSTNGLVVITAEFDYDSDADQALDRVVRNVSSIREQLPADIARINYRRVRTTEAAIVQLALVSNDSSWLLMSKYSEDIRDRLNVVPGVRDVEIYGLAEPELRVAIDSQRLAELGIPSTDLAPIVAKAGTVIPAGSANSGDRRLNVDTGGSFRTIQSIKNTLIRTNSGRFVTIGDVADVNWSEAEHMHKTRFNGDRAVFIAVRQKDGIDALALREKLRVVVDELGKSLPPNLKLETGFDQTQDIKRRLDHLARDFAIALVAVLIMLIPLGIRASLVVMVSIPLSLAMGIFVLFQLGYTLNQISIAGFIISLGLLVDDSIVVTENIERHLRAGKARVDAVVQGTREISMAVLGSTGVLLFAFFPLIFIPDSSGDFVRGLPMAVTTTIVSSLIVSFTVVPFVASRLLKRNDNREGNVALQKINNGIQKFYQPILKWAMQRPRSTLLGSMTVCVIAIASIPLLGTSLFPPSDSPYFLVRVEMPEGSGLLATERVVREVSKTVASFPGVTARMENVGRGNPQIFFNSRPRENDPRLGEIFVTVDHWNPTETPIRLNGLRKKLNENPNAKISVIQFENGPPVIAPVAFRVFGPEIGKLGEYAEKVARIMRENKGLRDVENPLAGAAVDIDIGFDSASANLLGVRAIDMRNAVRLALNGERASTFLDAEGDSYPVVVRLPMTGSQPVDVLESVYVPSQNGSIVALNEIAMPQLKTGATEITHYQLERTVTVSAFNELGILSSDINADIVSKLEKLKFSDGYRWEVAGAAEAAARNTSGLGNIILVAIFGILLILVAEFRSFRAAAVVLGVIPLGMFGGIVALFATGNSVSFLAIIGFIALIGIEIKNAILLVDFASKLQRDGFTLQESIEHAGTVRFLPVLLTSVTAIAALIPLALSGAPLYSPLAWVIIGGLISSTLLSRVVTPVMYLLIVRGTNAIKLANEISI